MCLLEAIREHPGWCQNMNLLKTKMEIKVDNSADTTAADRGELPRQKTYPHSKPKTPQ